MMGGSVINNDNSSGLGAQIRSRGSQIVSSHNNSKIELKSTSKLTK